MSLPRVVSQRVSCQTCAAVARSLTTPFSSNGSNALRASWTASRPQRRAFTSSPLRRGDIEIIKGNPSAVKKAILEAEEAEDLEEDFEEDMEFSPSDAETIKTSQDPPIPWYLRVQDENNPEGVAPERSDRELIPELPHNPPPLLQTLLEYISITAGLDDLLLFDLRHLDPPPALGSKLIMIIGTARSEKHLHVAADRFCRYLRREHGLKANAAGLLGRNELKIKLRRKAKRMKMLANVGGQETGNIDDGIRTGWICCTIGRLEAHPDDTEIPGLENENFVGFRDVKPGVNVVVQMFTEEKRQETDLETLWSGVLKSHERKDAVADEQLRELGDHLDKKEEEFLLEERQKRIDAALEATMLRPADSQEKVDDFKWVVPKASKGDDFPEASWDRPRNMQQKRRLHTVGLSRSL